MSPWSVFENISRVVRNYSKALWIDEEDYLERRSCKILLPREAAYKSNLTSIVTLTSVIPHKSYISSLTLNLIVEMY